MSHPFLYLSNSLSGGGKILILGCDKILSWGWLGCDKISSWGWLTCDKILSWGWLGYDKISSWGWFGCDKISSWGRLGCALCCCLLELNLRKTFHGNQNSKIKTN